MLRDSFKTFPNIIEISKKALADKTLSGDINNYIKAQFIIQVEKWKERVEIELRELFDLSPQNPRWKSNTVYDFIKEILG